MEENVRLLGGPYTVGDLLTSGHLGTCRVLAGKSGLGRRVSTMSVLTSPDPSPWLFGGEFTLTNGYVIKEAPGGLRGFVELLNKRGCSGLGVKLDEYMNDIPESAKRLADALGFPLLQVPREIPWGVAIGDFVQHVRNMHLIDACLAEPPTRPLRALRALTAGMSQAFNASFAVLDRDSNVLASVPAILNAPPYDDCRDAELVRVEPVTGADGLLGYVVAQAATPAGFPPTFDVLWRFAKLLAANHLTLLNLRQEVSLSRARSLKAFMATRDIVLLPQEFGCLPKEAIRVVATGPLDDKADASEAIRVLAATEGLEGALGGPTTILDDTAVSIARLTDRAQIEKALAVDYAFTESRSLRFGVSQETRAEYLGQAVREALSALSVAKAMNKGSQRSVFYEEIGLMSLMLEQVAAEHLEELFEDTLGKLKATGTSWPELLMTLEVYLETDGSASETAKRLHIHPSTLKYRLQRIRSAIPFSTFEDKIRVYAALNLHRLSRSESPKQPH